MGNKTACLLLYPPKKLIGIQKEYVPLQYYNLAKHGKIYKSLLRKDKNFHDDLTYSVGNELYKKK